MSSQGGLGYETVKGWCRGGFWRTNHGYDKMFLVFLCILITLFGLGTVSGAPLLTVPLHGQQELRHVSDINEYYPLVGTHLNHNHTRVPGEAVTVPLLTESVRHRRDINPARHTRYRPSPKPPRRSRQGRTTSVAPRPRGPPQPPLCFDDVPAKAYLAGTVFEGKARSRSPLRNGAYNVTFVVVAVFKGGEAGFTRSPVRLQFMEKEGEGPECPATGPLVRANIKRGGKYVVFVDKVGPHSFVARGEPAVRSKINVQAVRDVLCQNCVRKPSLTGLNDVTLKSQEKLRLICRTRGNPLPLLHWYKDGVRVVAGKGSNIKIRNKKRRTTLVIPKLRPEDAGLYECRASSATGATDRISSQVTVNTETRQDNSTILWRIPRPCPIEHYCMNEGTCTYYDTVGELSCSCAEGYKGTRCEEKDVYNRANGSMYRPMSYFCKLGISSSYYC